MSNVYVRSGAAGAGTGADWANAYLTLAAALTAKAAGDSFFVSEDHAETQASLMTLTSPGTAASPCFIYCVNHLGSVPPVSADLRTSATISTTGNSGLNMAGFAYCSGITFNCGDGANATVMAICQASAAAFWYFRNCALAKKATSTQTSAIQFGSNATTFRQRVVLDNTTISLGSTGDSLNKRQADLVWKNTPSAIVGATLPTTLFSVSSEPGTVLVEGVDLSALGSGKTLVGAGSSATRYIFKDCALGASVTIAATPNDQAGPETLVIRSDSSGTNYRHEKYQYMGTQTVETTIVRTGGATDGTTPISWKIVTTANSKWVLPFECIPITIWNDSTGAMTVTLFGNFTSVPNDDQIWMDVEYLGAAGNPQGSFVTTTKADNLAASAASNNTSDTSTWGAGGTTAFKMTSPSFTPAQKGPITIYVKAALASSTFYIDPQVSITGVSVSKSQILAPGVYANERFASLPFSRIQLGM